MCNLSMILIYPFRVFILCFAIKFWFAKGRTGLIWVVLGLGEGWLGVLLCDVKRIENGLRRAREICSVAYNIIL